MKEWYKSRTLWVNVISLVVMMLGQMMQWQEVQAYSGEMLMAMNALNIVLRLLTSEGLK